MKWFINTNNKIQGPFNNAEVTDVLQNIGTGATFLWSRGMNEWIQADKWSPVLAQTPEYERNFSVADTQVDSSAKTTIAPVPAKNTIKYKVQYDFKEQPEMTRDQLLEFTLHQNDISKISIMDPLSKEWKEIYAFPEIAEKLGLSRRKNSRVPILAQFSGQSSRGQKLNCRVITVSIAGLGLTHVFDLSIGDTIRGQITSPHFFTPLNIEAEVTYTGSDGYVGLRFSQINDDTLGLITEYVNKFGDKED